MGDPVTTAMIGAGIGAATSDDPVQGAVLGGLGGFAGGSMLGAGAGGAGLANAAGTGLTATGAGSQAGMLAAQNAGLGMTADMATKAALASNTGSMMAPMYQGMSNAGMALSGLPGGGDSANLIRTGGQMMSQGQQAPALAQAPLAAPPPPQRQARSFAYGDNPGQPLEVGAPYTVPRPSLLRF